LPGMDGLSLTRIIKSDERLRRIPIIALTAYAMRGDDLKAAQAGCDGYIIKPIDTRVFGGQVRRMIEAARERSTTFQTR